MKLMAASVLCAALAAVGCRRQGLTAAPLRDLFGPVVGREVITGRADAQDGSRIWLLTGDRTLVTIEIDRGSVSRHSINVPATEVCWGLARLSDGSLWTLKGRTTLAQLSDAGEVVRELALGAPHFGLFADHDRLLYQPANFEPPAPVLFAGPPGEAATMPWSAIRSRPYKLARGSVAVLNMITCGVGRGKERPCWFPDEAAVSLVGTDGTTRRVPLAGLPQVSPEVLLTSDNPARPVRDAYVAEDGTIWILGSGTPPSSPVEDRPGGWILARYSSDGASLGIQRLSEPARLIVRASSGRALILTGRGVIAEVRP